MTEESVPYLDPREVFVHEAATGIGQKKGSDEIVGTLVFSVVETRGIEPLTSKMRIPRGGRNP